MFSRRSSFPTEPNELTHALARARAEGRPVLDLTASNPTTVGLPYPRERLLSALASPAALEYRPEPLGLCGAREAIASRIDHPADRLVLTASTSEAYAFLFDLLADPDDEILVPRPSYPLLDYLGSIESVRLVPYDLHYDGEWHLDRPAIEASIRPRTRAIVVVSPNNPTGNVLTESDRLFLEGLGLPRIVDEVFAAYPLESESPPVPAARSEHGLVFSLSGLSKLAALPQTKLAWIAVGGEASLVRVALARLELLADTFLSVGTPVQLAAGELIDATEVTRDAIRVRTRRNLATLDAALGSGSPISRLFVEAGWYAILRLPAIESEERWALDLLEDGVLVQPGYFYDLVGGPYVVLSLLAEEEVFSEGARRLVERVGRAVA